MININWNGFSFTCYTSCIFKSQRNVKLCPAKFVLHECKWIYIFSYTIKLYIFFIQKHTVLIYKMTSKWMMIVCMSPCLDLCTILKLTSFFKNTEEKRKNKEKHKNWPIKCWNVFAVRAKVIVTAAMEPFKPSGDRTVIWKTMSCFSTLNKPPWMLDRFQRLESLWDVSRRCTLV